MQGQGQGACGTGKLSHVQTGSLEEFLQHDDIDTTKSNSKKLQQAAASAGDADGGSAENRSLMSVLSDAQAGSGNVAGANSNSNSNRTSSTAALGSSQAPTARA